ncbi:hypothetical protein [Cupriavidus numazuensis]|uniref:hypothetical protein n=1 Tax=Cupriavidus numazuensis TaxID=221992 RepID=UPI001BA7B7A1|nr:hypothetical protein [Cupriavidus numazuensis]
MVEKDRDEQARGSCPFVFYSERQGMSDLPGKFPGIPLWMGLSSIPWFRLPGLGVPRCSDLLAAHLAVSPAEIVVWLRETPYQFREECVFWCIETAVLVCQNSFNTRQTPFPGRDPTHEDL